MGTHFTNRMEAIRTN